VHFVYLCVSGVLLYLRICVFAYLGILVVVNLCICVFVYYCISVPLCISVLCFFGASSSEFHSPDLQKITPQKTSKRVRAVRKRSRRVVRGVNAPAEEEDDDDDDDDDDRKNP